MKTNYEGHDGYYKRIVIMQGLFILSNLLFSSIFNHARVGRAVHLDFPACPIERQFQLPGTGSPIYSKRQRNRRTNLTVVQRIELG